MSDLAIALNGVFAKALEILFDNGFGDGFGLATVLAMALAVALAMALLIALSMASAIIFPKRFGE